MMKVFLPTWLFCLFVFNAEAQEMQVPSEASHVKAGQQIFQDQCSRCHLFGEQKIGPSLASITDKKPVDWLVYFIQNSQEVIGGGDAYANYLFRSYHGMVMPAFNELSEEQVLDVLSYIQQESLAQHYVQSKDSVNEYDKELISKARERSLGIQQGETNYYASGMSRSIPTSTEVVLHGKQLFEAHCRECHYLDRRQTGSALASVTDRRPVRWLVDFIRSPQAVLESGDDYANHLLMNYPLVMPDFNYLDSAGIMSILAYLKNESGALTHEAGVNAGKTLDIDRDASDLPLPGTSHGANTDYALTWQQMGYWKVVGVALVVALVVVVVIIIRKAFKRR